MSLPLFKAVADTSIEAYHAIRPSLETREQAVIKALQREREAPTAYELYESMKRAGAVFDLNSVRPRLTALKTRGLVQRGAKRICRITQKRVYTWEIAS